MEKEFKQEDFPRKARYKRNKNRIYFSTDFKDNEEIMFSHFCGRPNAHKEGLAFYTNGRKTRLTNIHDIEALEY